MVTSLLRSCHVMSPQPVLEKFLHFNREHTFGPFIVQLWNCSPAALQSWWHLNLCAQHPPSCLTHSQSHLKPIVCNPPHGKTSVDSELLLHGAGDEAIHMLMGRNIFCMGRVSVFLATACVNGEVLQRTSERAWVLLCNLTEVVVTRRLQPAWDINHNCWGLYKIDVFFRLAYRKTQRLLHEERNLDFSVPVSKIPDVFMFSILYISLRPTTAEEKCI